MQANKISYYNKSFGAKMDTPTLQLGWQAMRSAVQKRKFIRKFAHMWGEIECAPGQIFSKDNSKNKQQFYFFHDNMKTPKLLMEIQKDTDPIKKLSFLYLSLKAMISNQKL